MYPNYHYLALCQLMMLEGRGMWGGSVTLKEVSSVNMIVFYFIGSSSIDNRHTRLTGSAKVATVLG
jgi:hypothetical protein